MEMDVVYYWVGLIIFWLLSSIGGVLLLAIGIGTRSAPVWYWEW